MVRFSLVCRMLRINTVLRRQGSRVARAPDWKSGGPRPRFVNTQLVCFKPVGIVVITVAPAVKYSLKWEFSERYHYRFVLSN